RLGLGRVRGNPHRFQSDSPARRRAVSERAHRRPGGESNGGQRHSVAVATAAVARSLDRYSLPLTQMGFSGTMRPAARPTRCIVPRDIVSRRTTMLRILILAL